MSIETMKQALEALETVRHKIDSYQVNVCDDVDKAITSLRQAIAEFDSQTLYREGYVNGYAFGEAAGRKAVAKQDGACQHCAGKGCVACDAREQEPVTCKECHLKDTVYDLLGDLKVANLKLSVRSKRTWVGLTDEDLPALAGDNGKVMELQQVRRFAKAIETKLKEKNT